MSNEEAIDIIKQTPLMRYSESKGRPDGELAEALYMAIEALEKQTAKTGDLISRQAIKEQFDPNTWQGELMIAVADNLPTAYDLEAVLRELEDHLKYERNNDKPCYAQYAFSRAIEIVKGGRSRP